MTGQRRDVGDEVEADQERLQALDQRIKRRRGHARASTEGGSEAGERFVDSGDERGRSQDDQTIAPG
jgi:hypothetical protein